MLHIAFFNKYLANFLFFLVSKNKLGNLKLPEINPPV